MDILLGNQEHFKNIGQVKYEGKDSDNPFAFRWYDASRVVARKTMADHFKSACAYWHSFNANRSEPIGRTTLAYPWDKKSTIIVHAQEKMDAALEFITKMQLSYYCFHDVDWMNHTDNIEDNERHMEQIVAYAKEKQRQSGVK